MHSVLHELHPIRKEPRYADNLVSPLTEFSTPPSHRALGALFDNRDTVAPISQMLTTGARHGGVQTQGLTSRSLVFVSR